MMNRELIQTFLVIKNTHNISKAADLLHRTQSAVSHRLRQLEEELGVLLITRQKGHKNVALTAQGEEFVSIAERWLLLDEEAQMVKHKVLRTRLSVSGVDSLNRYLFADFFTEVCVREPTLDLHVFCSRSNEIYDMLQAQVIDVGIVNNDAFRPDIVSELLFSEPFVAVGQFPGLDSGSGRTIHPATLDPAKGVFQPFSPDFQQWRHYWFGMGKSLIQVDSVSMVEPLLRVRENWCIVPLSAARMVAGKVPCSWHFLKEGPPDRTCFLITHKYEKPYNISALKLFTTLVREYIANHLPAEAKRPRRAG